MTADFEIFLDDTPGETRGIVSRNGRYERLLIQREGDSPSIRLGARSVARVARVDAGLRGVWLELPETDLAGFAPLVRGAYPEGAKVEVVVEAERRERKGPTLSLIGPAEGDLRLLAPGPSIEDIMVQLAPGRPLITGVQAIDAALEAEEAALRIAEAFPEAGIDVAVQRTRALIAIDVDFIGGSGAGRDHANRFALAQAARMIRLRGWAGLVVVDLVGSRHDGPRRTAEARAAFGDDRRIAFGPISRFGVLQLSLPWERTPLDDMLNDIPLRTRAIAAVRRLKRSLLTDTASPRIHLRCAPDIVEQAALLAARLGPRAGVAADPGLFGADLRLEEA